MLIIRTLGFVYSAAFLIVALQGRPLIGVDGLTPVPLLSEPKNLPIQGWFFTIFGWNNRVLECLGWVGFILSLLLCSGRISNPIIAFILWALYESFYYVMIAYAVIQVLDGNVLVPLLFSEAVNLHPVAILLAVLFFGGIWGVPGVFFAIPLATLVKAVINAWPAPSDG